MDRGLLHSQAEAIFRQLLFKFGAELPEEVRSVLGYYQSCRIGFDRAAEHVLGLRGRWL